MTAVLVSKLLQIVKGLIQIYCRPPPSTLVPTLLQDTMLKSIIRRIIIFLSRFLAGESITPRKDIERIKGVMLSHKTKLDLGLRPNNDELIDCLVLLYIKGYSRDWVRALIIQAGDEFEREQINLLRKNNDRQQPSQVNEHSE